MVSFPVEIVKKSRKRERKARAAGIEQRRRDGLDSGQNPPEPGELPGSRPGGSAPRMGG